MTPAVLDTPTLPTLADVLPELTAPFPIEVVEIKPGSVNRDGTSALALPYADWRLYADRLDRVVGPAHWSIQLIPWGDQRVIARLTILGVTKDSSGEGDPHDDNCGTIAEAQAKKRACAEFGLGRYFYHLPRLWGKGEGDRKSFRFHAGEPGRLVHEMYRAAGLLPPEEHTPPRDSSSAPVRTVETPTRTITERQLALLHDRDQLKNAQTQYGVTRLEDLTFAQASGLIAALGPSPRSPSPRRVAA